MDLPDTFTWVAALFDNATKALLAAGVFVTALLTRVAFKARKEPPPPGTPDALILALGELTKVTKGQSGNFERNMELFEEIYTLTEKLLEETRDLRRTSEQMREHLSAIRDAVNRR